MKLAGMLFIVLSAGSVGIGIGIAAKRRCQNLRQLLHALQALEREISFGASPLPDALKAAANAANGDIQQIFLQVSTRLDAAPWTSPKTALELSLTQTEEPWNNILRSLFGQIGKYDLQLQLAALERAEQEAEAALQELEQERSIKSGTYETLSICAGLAAAILLI